MAKVKPARSLTAKELRERAESLGFDPRSYSPAALLQVVERYEERQQEKAVDAERKRAEAQAGRRRAADPVNIEREAKALDAKAAKAARSPATDPDVAVALRTEAAGKRREAAAAKERAKQQYVADVNAAYGDKPATPTSTPSPAPTPAAVPAAVPKPAAPATRTATKPVAPAAATTPGATTPPATRTSTSKQTTGQPKAAPDAKPVDLEDYLGETYGYLAAFVSHPEVGSIIKQSGAEGWSKERLRGALYETNFWRETTDKMRQWDAQKALDLRTTMGKVQAQAQLIRDEAARAGVSIADGPIGVAADGRTPIRQGRVGELAETALRLGWTAAETTAAIIREAKFKPQQGGTLGANVSAMKAKARAYLLKMDEATLFSLAQDVAAGRKDEAGVDEFFRGQARQHHPQFQAAIDNGYTPAQAMSSQKQAIADLMELDPEGVDLLDPKWSWALQQDDGKGGFRPATVWETQQRVKKLPEWQGTKNGQETGWKVYADLKRTLEG